MKRCNKYRGTYTSMWPSSFNTFWKQMTSSDDLQELMETTMTKRLKPSPPHTKVTKDKTKVPDLETITQALTKKFPGQSLPDASICAKIGEVSSQLNAVHKAYSEAAEELAELSTLMMPDQFTLLLTATTIPAIQLIILGHLMSPLSTPPPPEPQASTALGGSEIMNFTKLRVLPNPDSEALLDCDKYSPTKVLAAAIYCKLEHNYFNKTHSRMDIVTAFCCNTSQLSKAVTGIDYKSGPHHYKPKQSSK